MSSTAQSPLPLTLWNGDKQKDYVFARLTDQDIGLLDAWVRKRFVQTVRASFDDTMSREEKHMELQIAHERAATLDWLSPHGARLSASVEGMAYLSWVALHKNHPEVTLEEMRSMMVDERNIDAVSEALEESRKLAPFHGAPKTGQTTKAPKQRSKRKSKPRKKKKGRG